MQWMSGWLNSVATHLSNADVMLCDSPSRHHGKSIRSLSKIDFCVDSTAVESKSVTIVSFFVSAGAAFAVAILGVIVVYRLRVFFHVRWKFHPFDRDECVGEDLNFDVFLMCNYADHNQYGRPLLESLARHNYHVCYHLKDFIPGETIQNNMVQAVERSRRTLCVLTENFANR
jgi:protein toll